MFAEFIKRLTQPDPAQLPDGDARLALTALLVRIAKSDNEYAPSERARIDQIIAKRYALDADGTASLRADAGGNNLQIADGCTHSGDVLRSRRGRNHTGRAALPGNCCERRDVEKITTAGV